MGPDRQGKNLTLAEFLTFFPHRLFPSHFRLRKNSLNETRHACRPNIPLPVAVEEKEDFPSRFNVRAAPVECVQTWGGPFFSDFWEASEFDLWQVKAIGGLSTLSGLCPAG